MNFKAHRPPRFEGRGDRYLPKIIGELKQVLIETQQKFAYESLCLTNQECETMAHLLVEFAEDIHNEIGIWRSLEQYHRDFFGVPLPLTSPVSESERTPSLEERLRHLLWVLYPEIEPDLILGPTHQDLHRLAAAVADFLTDRLARVPKQSGVKQLLATPNRFGWEVKRKLVWLGQHSYLFRLSFQNYLTDHDYSPTIAVIDDFICQQTTAWSGLGAIDLLAGILALTDSQRTTLRGWYERHLAFYRVRAVKGTILRLVNLINDRPYKVKLDQKSARLKAGEVVYGGLLPWEGGWYWSGEQRLLGPVPPETVEELKGDMLRQAAQIVYRYHPELLAQAEEIIKRHYRAFLEYHGDDLVVYPDGRSMAADTQKMYRLQNEQVPEPERSQEMEKHGLTSTTPNMPYPPALLKNKNGVGLYFHRGQGTEIMVGFHDIVSGLKKRGNNLSEDEVAAIQGFMESEAISPSFVQKLVQDEGAESIAAAYLLHNFQEHPYYLDYLLRRYKGDFYRKRYPQIALIE